MQAPPLLPTLSIAAVERDTGLSKDTLRIWERRYGFPRPARDAAGERAYPLEQVERLRTLKRLLDAGHRPGRIVGLARNALQQLAEATVEQPTRGLSAAVDGTRLRQLVALLQQGELRQLRAELTGLLARLGVAAFVSDVIAPLNQAVGDAWMRGRLQVYEEHLYSELVQTLLRQALSSLPAAEGTPGPRVLLTSLPGEPHGLGLLMAEAMFALEGCVCLPLGPQTPLLDTVQAAKALRVDIVALGFAGCLGHKQVLAGVAELRAKLPPTVAVWAGGHSPGLRRHPPQGVRMVDSLTGIAAALAAPQDASPD